MHESFWPFQFSEFFSFQYSSTSAKVYVCGQYGWKFSIKKLIWVASSTEPYHTVRVPLINERKINKSMEKSFVLLTDNNNNELVCHVCQRQKGNSVWILFELCVNETKQKCPNYFLMIMLEPLGGMTWKLEKRWKGNDKMNVHVEKNPKRNGIM